MPISLQSYSRRDFMHTVLGATAGCVTIRTARGESAEIDPNYFVLMADTHIATSPSTTGRGQNMYDNLKQAITRILGRTPRPTALIINGDCAFNIGERESYVNLSTLLQPLREAGVAIHMSMGNHDHRENFYSVFSDMQPDPLFIDNRHILILDTEHAYLFILDSLDGGYAVKGEFGPKQLAWLDNALAEHADKPVHVLAHHYPKIEGMKTAVHDYGIQDQTAFFGILSNHSHVQSYIYGHAHIWEAGHTYRSNFEAVCQPTTAYLFDDEQPLAYLHAHIAARGMDLTLEALDTNHIRHGQEYTLAKTGRIMGMR